MLLRHRDLKIKEENHPGFITIILLKRRILVMSQKENLTNVLNATQKMTTFSDLAEIWLQEKKCFLKNQPL